MRGTVANADVDSGAVQVGAAIYRKRGSVIFPLNQYNTRDSLNAGINGMKLMRAKDSSVSVGLDTVRQNIFTPSQGDRPDAPNVVIVITDADATEHVQEIPTAAQMLKDDSGARVFTVGIGLDSGQLGMVASSDDDAFQPGNYGQLGPVQDKIIDEVAPRKEFVI